MRSTSCFSPLSLDLDGESPSVPHEVCSPRAGYVARKSPRSRAACLRVSPGSSLPLEARVAQEERRRGCMSRRFVCCREGASSSLAGERLVSLEMSRGGQRSRICTYVVPRALEDSVDNILLCKLQTRCSYDWSYVEGGKTSPEGHGSMLLVAFTKRLVVLLSLFLSLVAYYLLLNLTPSPPFAVPNFFVLSTTQRWGRRSVVPRSPVICFQKWLRKISLASGRVTRLQLGEADLQGRGSVLLR